LLARLAHTLKATKTDLKMQLNALTAQLASSVKVVPSKLLTSAMQVTTATLALTCRINQASSALLDISVNKVPNFPLLVQMAYTRPEELQWRVTAVRVLLASTAFDIYTLRK